MKDVTGETPDISDYLDFGLYDHVSYKDNAGLGMTDVGRRLGVSHRFVGLMPSWILTKKGTLISRKTVQRITSLEKDTDEVKASVSEFDTEIIQRFMEEEDLTYEGSKPNPEYWSEYLKDDPEFHERGV